MNLKEKSEVFLRHLTDLTLKGEVGWGETTLATVGRSWKLYPDHSRWILTVVRNQDGVRVKLRSPTYPLLKDLVEAVQIYCDLSPDRGIFDALLPQEDDYDPSWEGVVPFQPNFTEIPLVRRVVKRTQTELLEWRKVNDSLYSAYHQGRVLLLSFGSEVLLQI